MYGKITRKVISLLTLIFLFVSIVSPSALAAAYDETHPEILTDDNLNADAVILIEQETGEVIYEKNADKIMYPASTTKIMTILLGVMFGDMDKTVTASTTALDIPSDSSVISLYVGEEISFRNLLLATQVKSGNDGANMIAEAISGSQAEFVNLMNQTAAVMGCTNTHFANATGLHDENHYTTARDLATIARIAMQYAEYREIAATTVVALPKSNMRDSRRLTIDNPYLSENERYASYYYPYSTGIKTGFHSAAGYCFVGSATKEGVSLISVVLNTSAIGRWTDTKKLMEYGFSQYVSVTPLQLFNLNPKVIDINGYDLNDSEKGRLQLVLEKTAEDMSLDDSITTTQGRVDYLVSSFNSLFSVEFTREFRAPVMQGEVMGTVTYYKKDGTEIHYQLKASRSVAAREGLAPTINEIRAEVDDDPNFFPPVSLELVLFVLSPVLVVLALIFLVKKLLKKLTKKKIKTARPSGRYYR